MEGVALAIKMLLSAYRKDDYADPEGFVAQLGAILERYDPAVVDHVTSPYTGIQRQLRFPPTIAEVVSACDAEADRRERLARYQSMPGVDFSPRPRPKREPGTDYESMIKKHGRPIGFFEDAKDQWNRHVKVPSPAEAAAPSVEKPSRPELYGLKTFP